MRISHHFLRDLTHQHDWCWGAIAELVHNSKDAGAKSCKIYVRLIGPSKVPHLVVEDDGSGMTHKELNNALMFGRDNDRTRVAGSTGRYGIGLKASSMRMGDDALIITKSKDTFSIGLFSQTYNKTQDNVHIPILTRFKGSTELDLSVQSEQAALDAERIIEKHSAFNRFTIGQQLARMANRGTMVIMWNLRKDDEEIERRQHAAKKHKSSLKGKTSTVGTVSSSSDDSDTDAEDDPRLAAHKRKMKLLAEAKKKKQEHSNATPQFLGDETYELKFKQVPGDLQLVLDEVSNMQERSNQMSTDVPLDYSLRAYLSMVFLDDVMQMYVQGQKVEHLVWERYLKNTRTYVCDLKHFEGVKLLLGYSEEEKGRGNCGMMLYWHCLRWDTRVALANGDTIRCQDVRATDMLLTHDGMSARVARVQLDLPSAQLYRIETSVGAYEVTQQHRVTVQWRTNPTVTIHPHESHDGTHRITLRWAQVEHGEVTHHERQFDVAIVEASFASNFEESVGIDRDVAIETEASERAQFAFEDHRTCDADEIPSAMNYLLSMTTVDSFSTHRHSLTLDQLRAFTHRFFNHLRRTLSSDPNGSQLLYRGAFFDVTCRQLMDGWDDRQRFNMNDKSGGYHLACVGAVLPSVNKSAHHADSVSSSHEIPSTRIAYQLHHSSSSSSVDSSKSYLDLARFHGTLDLAVDEIDGITKSEVWHSPSTSNITEEHRSSMINVLKQTPSTIVAFGVFTQFHWTAEAASLSHDSSLLQVTHVKPHSIRHEEWTIDSLEISYTMNGTAYCTNVLFAPSPTASNWYLIHKLVITLAMAHNVSMSKDLLTRADSCLIPRFLSPPTMVNTNRHRIVNIEISAPCESAKRYALIPSLDSVAPPSIGLVTHNSTLIETYRRVGVQAGNSDDGLGVIGVCDLGEKVEPNNNKQCFPQSDKYFKRILKWLASKLDSYWHDVLGQDRVQVVDRQEYDEMERQGLIAERGHAVECERCKKSVETRPFETPPSQLPSFYSFIHCLRLCF